MSIQQRRERERSRRHELIVDTARDLAEAQGWDAVTTRRLAERIEYSQPVLYSHFAGKDAIVTAVAVQGFAELAAELARARDAAATPAAALYAAARTYLVFADSHPAVYDAMFTQTTDLPFAQPDAPAPLQEAFTQLREALAPFAGTRDPDTLAEVGWAALHGQVTLARGGRLRPEHLEQRLAMLVEQLVTQPAR